MNTPILPDFQKFLIDNKFASEKVASYYAYWASRFISFSNKNSDLNLDLKISKFIDYLASDKNITGWKINQAEEAVKLYLNNFLKNDSSDLNSNLIELKEGECNSSATIILKKMREAIRLKHYSYSTEKTYIDWAQRFYNYVLNEKKKNISELNFDENDLKDFLTYLAITRRVASSTQNQAFNALLFLFKNILNISVNNLGETVRAKRGPKLPVVLSTQEVQKVFAGSSGTRLLILKLIYGAGLRLMDLLRLRVKDIDFDYNTIFIRGGKGDKDRTTMLPQKIREDLIKHIEKVKALHEDDLNKGFGEVSLPNALDIKYPNAPKELGWQYVFPSANLSVDPRSGKIKRHHLNEKTVQNAMKNAVKKAGIIKHATVHTLRHSFATHMLMNGVNIIEIQDLLGHKNVETTMIYTHVMRDMSNAPKSPLDLLK